MSNGEKRQTNRCIGWEKFCRACTETTQTKVARLCGIPQPTVSLIVAGSQRPSIEYIFRIEDELGISVYDWRM